MDLKADDDFPLQGLRILIADDEFLIAIVIEETLRDAGAETAVAATLGAALEIAQAQTFSAALLDVRLGRETTEAVADSLFAQGVPFAFYSGQALPPRVREKYPNAVLLNKPVNQDVFVETLLKLVGRRLVGSSVTRI